VDEVLAPVLGLIVGICLAFVILIIALILFLLGVVSLHSGRYEFKQPHTQSFQKGLTFVVIGVLVSIFAGVFGQVAGAFVSIFTSIMISLGLIFLVYELADDQGKTMLWTAGILYIIISVVNAIVILWLFMIVGFGDMVTAGDPVAENVVAESMTLLMIPIALSSLALIPITIFYMAYRKIYSRIKNRVIQPVMVQPPPFGAQYPPHFPQGMPPYPPGPGAYPPPYPPQYPPPVQQPYQPPPTAPPYTQGPQGIGIKPSGIKRCMFCGSQIPTEAALCPSCRRPV
jgi:hypothetical protein